MYDLLRRREVLDDLPMKYLSVCSGIEAASVAWHPLGWTPVGFAEIESFPSAVLAHHYPNVPNLGDMTKFKDWNVEDIDLLVGGTPCQAFSVAGLRGGLSDSRGNLTLTFVEMADHFDPNWIVWENVPGVLSSQDNAFGCFLAGLVGASEPLVPDGRWDNSGLVSGPKRTAAWRILDAQYFGVAQRRRRVFVCAVRGSRNWAAARAIFSVGESVYWDSAPRRETRQSIAPTVSSGAPFSRTGNERVEAQALVSHAFKVCQGCEGGGKGYLGSDELALTISTHQDQHIAQPITFGAQMSTPQTDVNLVQTLQAKNPMAVAQPVAFDGYSQTVSNICQTIRASKSDGDHVGMVLQPVAFAQNQRDEVRTMEIAGALAAEPGAKQQTYLHQAMQVRRLTPTECERLQGFPGGYTNIPWRNKPEAPDGPRYKALGNSMAVPVMHWIGKRINNLI